MKYRDETFYWTYQRGVKWPDDYIGPDSMTRWIIEKSQSFADVGLLRISECVRAYAYSILSLQASVRSRIIGNMASELTAQRAFLDNFENVVKGEISIREDIKRYQETLSYASSKVDYSAGENICMLPNDMNLNIRSGTVGYNDKILASNGTFILGNKSEVNTFELAKGGGDKPKIIHKAIAQPTVTHKTLSHEEKKVALVLTGGFTMWFMFR